MAKFNDSKNFKSNKKFVFKNIQRKSQRISKLAKFQNSRNSESWKKQNGNKFQKLNNWTKIKIKLLKKVRNFQKLQD